MAAKYIKLDLKYSRKNPKMSNKLFIHKKQKQKAQIQREFGKECSAGVFQYTGKHLTGGAVKVTAQWGKTILSK